MILVAVILPSLLGNGCSWLTCPGDGLPPEPAKPTLQTAYPVGEWVVVTEQEWEMVKELCPETEVSPWVLEPGGLLIADPHDVLELNLYLKALRRGYRQ
jgi:hypothetical protein